MTDSSSRRYLGILYLSFNQDCSFFAAGTERGFKIYHTYPFVLKYERSKNYTLNILNKYSHGWWYWDNRNAI